MSSGHTNIIESYKDSNLKPGKDFKIDLKKYNYYLSEKNKNNIIL